MLGILTFGCVTQSHIMLDPEKYAQEITLTKKDIKEAKSEIKKLESEIDANKQKIKYLKKLKKIVK